MAGLSQGDTSTFLDINLVNYIFFRSMHCRHWKTGLRPLSESKYIWRVTYTPGSTSFLRGETSRYLARHLTPELRRTGRFAKFLPASSTDKYSNSQTLKYGCQRGKSVVETTTLATGELTKNGAGRVVPLTPSGSRGRFTGKRSRAFCCAVRKLEI